MVIMDRSGREKKRGEKKRGGRHNEEKAMGGRKNKNRVRREGERKK